MKVCEVLRIVSPLSLTSTKEARAGSYLIVQQTAQVFVRRDFAGD